MSPYRRFVYWFLALAGVFVGLFWLAEFYTDWLWFRYDAFPIVFERRVATKLIVFALTAVVVYAILGLNVRAALRRRPAVRPADSGMDPELRAWLDTLMQPTARWLPPVLAVIAGLSAAEAWQLWLAALYGQPFGLRDPIFGLDVGFYVYRLAAWRQVLTSVSTMFAIALVAVVLLYAYLELIRVRDQEIQFARPARRHILILFAALMVLRALTLWLARYSLLLKSHRLFTGADWTSAHVTAPGLAFAALLALVAAACCLYVLRPGRGARLAYYAVALHVLGSVLGSTVVPAIFQYVRVTPNEYDFEEPYIKNAIAATRQSFGLTGVQERAFGQVADLTATDIARNRTTIDDVRVWDHRPLLRTFGQLQEIRQYYDIIDVDSDRYPIGGRTQQVLTSARELNHDQLDAKAKSWINLHLDYTHGYGLVVSSASKVSGEGQPSFLAQDIPPRTVPELRMDQPRIYFGEMILLPPDEIPHQSSLLPQQQVAQQNARPEEVAAKERERVNSLREPDEQDYLLVGSRPEFDYAETVGNTESQHKTKYAGKSGIPVGGLLRRLAFSLRLHSLELAVTDQIDARSKLIIHRQVTRRCNHAAPFLVWDTDPYAVVVDGRIQWICEAYTSSLSYPNAETHYELQASPRGPQWVPTWNYLRNPVKAVVDAYDGTVTLYVVDPKDPIIRTFERMFPGMFRSVEEAPAALRAHFRYPVLMFKTQMDMYRRYHMTNPRTFYNQEDLWAVAQEVDRETERSLKAQGRTPSANDLYRDMDPYYVNMTLPGDREDGFMLIASFTPYSASGQNQAGVQRSNLIAWMGALCDPERYGELRVYTFPKDTNVYGPLQVEARIDQDETISQQITLWDRGGSQVVRGNMTVIPIESSLLYVEPLYLESEKRGLPELKRVIVAYQDRVVMEPTLTAAIERLFGPLPATPSAPAVAPAPAPQPTGPVAAAPQAPAQPPAGPVAGLDRAAVAEAQKAFDAGEQALRAGDWARYQAEQQRLKAALGRLAK